MLKGDGDKQETKNKKKKKELVIKKNLLNPTAGIFYSLGLSIIHLSMFIAQFFVI